MSRQIEIYLTPTDIEILEQLLMEIEPLEVLHSRSPAASVRILKSLNFSENGHRWLFYGLIRRQDVKNIKMNYVAPQKYWAFDVMESPLIEFSSCFFDGKILRRGRFYYKKDFFLDAGLCEKDGEFLAWAAKVFLSVKKNLTRRGGFYYGKEAIELIDKNVVNIE
ncbi:hypothetical protein [Variovorax sp.]|jgi:hypothetical protein|uniref:hypothetical protein n=1 Tax=Variovorax sp. TaxID=1871043 RepID=UPI0037D9E766